MSATINQLLIKLLTSLASILVTLTASAQKEYGNCTFKTQLKRFYADVQLLEPKELTAKQKRQG